MGVVLVADVPLSVGSRKGKVIESGNWKRTKSVLSGGGGWLGLPLIVLVWMVVVVAMVFHTKDRCGFMVRGKRQRQVQVKEYQA